MVFTRNVIKPSNIVTELFININVLGNTGKYKDCGLYIQLLQARTVIKAQSFVFSQKGSCTGSINWNYRMAKIYCHINQCNAI